MTGNEKLRLKAGSFVRNNGKVLCTINILRIKYNKLTGVKNVLKGENIAEDEFLASVDFLAEEGYIHLRHIASKEIAVLADNDYIALEARLSGKGIRLLAGDAQDDMIEVSRSARSVLRAGNFVENNGSVLRILNLLSGKFNRLDELQGLMESDGVAEDEFLDSVNFLTEEGYIHLRQISTKEGAALADSDYKALEAKLTGKGNRLMYGGITDGLIEV